MISLGQSFGTVVGIDFAEETAGNTVFSIVAVEVGKTSLQSKTPGASKLTFYFDVAEGKNAGIYKDFQKKFGKPETPLGRYFSETFVLSADNLPFLKGFVAHISSEPENAEFKDAIEAVTARGDIDETLLIGRKIGMNTYWRKDPKSGYSNLTKKKLISVAEARKPSPQISKPERDMSKVQSTGDGFGGGAQTGAEGGWN